MFILNVFLGKGYFTTNIQIYFPFFENAIIKEALYEMGELVFAAGAVLIWL